jgi:hypothetical protein
VAKSDEITEWLRQIAAQEGIPFEPEEILRANALQLRKAEDALARIGGSREVLHALDLNG